MEDWVAEEDQWDSFPAHSTPTMVHAAHPVTTEVPPGFDGTTNWFRYADAVEEWCDLTKVEAKRRGPAVAARLTGRAEIYKERLDRDRLKDPETGVDYLLATLRPYFVKDLQSVFLYRFFQLLRCNRGQTDHQRWMIKYEIARQKAVDAWLEATTPRPAVDHADVAAQIERLRTAARDRARLEVRRDWVGAAEGLQAAVDAIALPEATEAMRQSAIESVWRTQRRGRVNLFPISDNLSALMALVMADLSESQRETLMNLIFQRNIELTDLTLQQLREFLITLFHAPKSSLENPSWSQRTGPRSFVSISYGELDQYEGHWVCDETNGDEGFLDEHEDIFWVYDEDQCYWMKYPFQGRFLRKGSKSKGGGKGKQGKAKGKGSSARRFFRPFRKGSGKGKKGGKGSSSTAKANIAEEEVEEEEIEDETLLVDKKKRKKRPQTKRKSKAQPAASTAHEAEAALDEEGFAYSAVSDLNISYDHEWCLKGTKGTQEEVEDGTSMILDTGCTKAMCSRHAYLLMRQGLSEDRVELLPDSSTFNFANGQKALAREKCRIWFSYEPPLFTDFSIIDEGKVPFLMSLPQMKNLGVSLDLRGTPEKIVFHTGFLKGQGVPLHRNRAGHLTLDVNEICKKARLSADRGRPLHAASSFPAVADEPLVVPVPEPPPLAAAEPVNPQPAVEKRYRLPSGQKVPPAHLHQRAAERRQPEAQGREEQGAEPAAVPPPVQQRVAKGAPSQPQPPEHEESEILPHGELSLDGLIPPPLVKLHQRLSRRTELLKLHLKHYHMSSAQFRRRTSELYLPEGIYRMYENVVKECEICQKTKPAPPRSRFSGVRAKEFGDVVFMDHCEIKHMTKKHQLFLVLDGATSLLWGATQQEGTEPVTQDLFREWMHVHSCKPRWVVADMAFFTPSWMTFWKTHGVKTMPTGRATPWPNRAETAVRLFKRQYEKLLTDASTHPTLNKVTLRDLIRECCWARNTTLTISGYTPVELATGRRPTDHSDLELMKPDQLSAVDLPRDATLNELRKLALKAHLEARQSADLRRDLARRVLPSDGPYAHGDRVFVWIDDKAKYKAVGRWARARVISQNGAIVTVETDKAVLRVNQSKVRRDYDPWHDVPLPRNLDKPEKEVPLEPDDETENLEENEGPADQTADYVQDFKTFLTKVKAGSFSALNVSFENSNQILELSSPSCSVTPLLIDYGLEASNPYDLNAVSSVSKLTDKLQRMRPSIVLFNLLGVDKKHMRQVLHDVSNELHEYINDTGFILVVLDSMSLPVLTKKSKHKIKELKNVEEHIFHPGGDSNHYCSMMTNMPRSYATYPLSQTSDRSKNRLAVFAVKLRESMKAYLSEKDDWPTSYYSELLLDTLLEDFTSTEIKDLDVWYGKHEMQEEVFSVSYKLTTDDKFLQNMMRSVDALPAKTEANLESVNGRSAEFFKTSVLYARRKLIPRLSFETSVIYRGTYGRKIPLSAMDDSCMILWWVKNKRPYQLFVTSSRDFMDVQRRMPASKISMVTFWSGRTSDVAQGGITMRDSATAGLGDQPPAPPRTLEQIPLQELYRPVPEEVLPPVTPPQIPAEQQIEVDDEDMQPPDQPQQSMQPPLTPPHGGLHVPLPDSPMQDSIPGSPGPPQDPPPPSPPPAGVPVQAPGSPLIHWYVAPGTPPWMPQAAVSHNQPPPPSPPPAAPMIAQQWMPPLWWPPVYPGPMPVAGGTFPSGGIPSSGGMMPLTITPTPVQPLQPMPPEPSPVSPVVQTLDKDEEEDIAEDQPMPAQPLLPARRPRADSLADPGVAVEAPADVVPVAPPAEVVVQAGLPVPAVEAPVETAVAPASKKARQYDLPPQQPLQPMPQLQPQLPASSSSPSALDDTTPTEPEAKKHKKHEDDDDEIDIDAPHQPTDPPVLPLSEHQPPVAADLEASRSRSRTHSEVSEAPTIPYQDPPHDPPRQIGQEEASLPEPPPAPPDPPSRTSSVAPTEFYSDIAKAHGRVHAQVGDEQDFLFWQNMGKHNLVLWLDYTEEATTYHTLDMSMWGAVRYRRTFSSHDCNLVQSVAIDHKYSPSAYKTTVPVHSGKGFFTEFWYDPQALDTAHWLCDSFADFIAPVSFVLISYMDEMALNATRKNRARKEATMKELKVYARLFKEAKSAEITSWFDNDVFDLVDIRKFKPKNFVTGRWVLTVKRDRDGKFQKCKARWVLRGFQDRQKDAQQTDSPTSTRPGLRLLCQNAASNGWSIRHIDLKTAFLQGESYTPDRDVVCQLPPEAGKPWYLAARLKKPAYGMNDAPRKWWNRLDAAVKAMGLLPARADRCTYVSYADVKKKKIKQVVHATGDNEATQSFEQTGHSLNEDSYNEVYENILQQLMETDEYDKLRVWTSDIEKRDVYLTAKKTSPAWKKVIMRKTVDVDTNKVIQVKYIGDENWGNLKEKIENGPKKVRTFMVYLNVESDMDTIMDYIIDPVAGSPSRNKTVNGNVCMHVDDLIFTGTGDFLSSFAESLKKSFQIGSLDENDVMFCGQRIIKQGATVIVHQDLCIEDLHEALIPKGNDGDALTGADLTEYRSVLGKLNWLQSRTQFHISYHFSRCASAAANATIMDAKELNKVVRLVKDKPQRLLYAPIKGTPRLMGFPDAAYKNNADGSSQRGQCIFICQPRNKERDTKGSLIDYESHKIKRTVLSTTVAELYAFMKCYGSAQFYRGLWMDMTAQPLEVHLRTDANNLVTTAASTRLPEQKETIHMIQMLRQEACSGQMHDLAHVLTQYCLADPLTKKSVSPTLLITTVQTGILREVDTHPLFRSTVQHKAFIIEHIDMDVEATLDHWGHLMCYPVYYKIQKGTMVSSPFEKGGKSPLVSKESLTGRCFVSAISPDGTRTTSTISERPMPSLEGLTGYVVFETHGGSRLSDYWQQKTKTRLSRVHVTPRKTLFSPSHAPVDLSLLSPGRTTRKDYLNGSTQTLSDTWTASVKGRDTEEWVGETVFVIEGCAHVPAQCMYVQGSSCTYSGDLDRMLVSPAYQAEENVVCNLDCRLAQFAYSRHTVSRRAITHAGVNLQGLPNHCAFVVNPFTVVSKMPGAPTRSAADNMTAKREQVGSPKILGANPNSYFLRTIPDVTRMDMFNQFINLYNNGRFFRQKSMVEEYGTEDPTTLIDLLVEDTLWYEQYFKGASKCLTALLRHNNHYEFQRIRRNKYQGDIALIDFLLTTPMKRNFPKLCPASLWALAHCMNKPRFTFGMVIGTDNLKCDPAFKRKFEDYLRTDKRVDPAEYEVMTIASCTGHSFVYTREIPQGESEDIEYLTPRSYARLGSICHGTALSNAQSILRQGLDVDYGAKTGMARRNMIHFCPSTNELPLKRQGLYCYLDLKVAITDLEIRVMYSKTAQIVLVEDRVPPEALCLTWKAPEDLGTMCLPHQRDLILPRGPDAPAVPIKKVGEIFKASPMLRPRAAKAQAASSLATITETQPIVIEDDEVPRTGASASSGAATGSTSVDLTARKSSMLKAPPVTRPKVLLKRPPVAVTKVPPPVEKYSVPRGPVVPHFNISDFPMVLPELASSLPRSPATTLAPETPLVLPSTVTAKPMPKGPPPIASPKPRQPTREQVQLEVDAIMRDAEEKRAKRSEQEQQLHDDMLSAIFKSVFEDTVPDSAAGIYSSGEKDRMGCEIPKVIEFRTLPVPVQDNLMRAEILPTMWPRYRISGHERMFHYCLMTVTRRQMLNITLSHNLSAAAIENMYPSGRDQEHRTWINSIMYSTDGPPDAVDQLINSAFECALSILRAAGSTVANIEGINPYQLDLFLFKDMGIGGILSQFISRMNDPEVGGYENYILPEPVATWYSSFYKDYMTYLDLANLDSVLAAQVASPGEQITIQFIALALERAEEHAQEEGVTLNEFLENRTIGDIVDQFTQEENADWLRWNDFFMGNNGHFAPIREVSEGSHDATMAETVSDVSMPDAEGAVADDVAATLDGSGATIQSSVSQETAGLSSSSASAPRTVLGAEAPPGVRLAIEDVKPDEFYQASNRIRSALQNLPEQLQNQEETQLEVWVHSTDRYDTGDLWTDVEYAKKACDRTGARIYFEIQLLSFGPDHPHMKPYTKVAIQGLLPYLDDYIMGEHDPFVEDFHWSMDDNRHTESQSPELTEGDVPNLLLFAPKEVIDRVRSQATSSSEPAVRRNLRGSRNFGQAEIKRHRQGLRVDELSSTDVLDVTVFNLGNLARQSIQRQAEPRMLRLIMNQTSHIMMLVEGTSLAVNQWDEKLRAEGWTLGSSDDHHHWVGVRTASSGTTVTPLVDNCGSTHQKIWYAIFDVRLGNTSDGRSVWKGGQNFYRVMVVHINHLVARTACRSCRINFADLLMLCAHFQVDLMGGDFNAFSYRYYRTGTQQIAASLQDSSLAVMLRRFDEAINAKRSYIINHPEYKFKSDLYMAYHDEHIEEYRLMREAIMEEVTDAAREATKIPRLQKALQEFDENFDVIGLINFNWDHTVARSPSHYLTRNKTPEPKSTIIKNKYAVRYLAGQEKMCRLSGMAQKITPELLQLRQRDHDMHKVLKVALQPWPTLAGKDALVDFGAYGRLRESYFRADYFCKYKHEDVEHRHKLRKTAADAIRRSGGDGELAPIVFMDKFFYELPRPRTTAQLNYRLVTGSSSSLTSSALGSLPSGSGGPALRSRYSVLGSEAGYTETVDGDYSDFEMAYGIYRR